ncbi:hypothetical protein SAMN05216354_1491 [Xylanibacter ruminicola]|jgi:hypothetical protein|uniref:Major fimbrial subunit protein N-terminal domain-containing protein n=1 Tax=Xylanibacter ruminicola TaxID=839 RepID=A0A1H5UIB9_XYLRU|nr:hypothetical protein [Xylanibacter ruminicola]SEF74774.1 hypothetical protein SAMN05216354_1491 [Xylanibacter ruminicola]
MKKIKFILLAVTLLTAITFSACSSESAIENEVNVVDPATTTVSTPKLVFQFNFPASDNRMAFTRAAVTQDDDEARVKSLWMYEFEARGGALISATNIYDDLTPVGGTYNYTYDQTAGYSDNRARRFIFIANDDAERTGVTNISDLIGNANGDDDEEVEMQLASTGTIATPADDAVWQTIDGDDVLPMTGEAIRNGNNIIAIDSTTAATVTVDLSRVVARIDVKNMTPDLTITGLKLVQANPSSYIYPHLDANGSIAVVSQTKVDNIAPFTAVPNDFTNEYNATGPSTDPNYDSDETGFLRKAFYVYEDSTTTAANRLTLQVSGFVGNVNVFYNIPFSKAIALKSGTSTTWQQVYDADNSDTEAAAKITEPVSVKRNTVYTVQIGDGTAIGIHTAVRATIAVADWDTQEVNETFDPDLFVYKGDVASYPALDGSGNPTGPNTTTGVWYHTSSQILDVPYTAITTDGDLKIAVSPNYSNLAITAVEVLAANTTDPEAWLAATLATGADAGKYFTITTTQNQILLDATPTYDTTTDTALRSRSIKVTYTITPTGGSAQTYYTIFTVRQAGFDHTAP